jgi:3-methylcrotonyl-CoA carboxylase alpha subunit/acetyl-CoA/propionyl-CoA carboxylase biotin carboxyl carrier protein
VEPAADAELVDRAPREVGFPLLVKAAAGGGGKGMRIVRDGAELPGALAAARREARAAFGDDTVLIERYVEHGRHVEVQVLADAHGSVVHLFERDCSVQRRHQKVLEEAPAPTISAAVRASVTAAAVRLAREVGYVNAGTVEFLVAGEDVYFLEMNTRLQVEHPVTECVTGLDLVALQLHVAQRRPLPFTQQDVRLDGHAIEARVYAEDPSTGFLPQAGVATTVQWSERARVDAALQGGQRVGTWYDPMLGKVIVHGATREAARRALIAALDDTAIFGLTTNLGFLRRLAASDAYRDAAIDTGWLDRHPRAFPAETPAVALCAAGWALAAGAGGAATAAVGGAGNLRHPFATPDGWRLAGPPAPVPLELEHRGERHVLRVDVGGGVVETGQRRWRVHPVASVPGRMRLEVDDVIQETALEISAHGVTVGHHGESYVFRLPDTFGPAGGLGVASGLVTAPMPGIVLAVNVEKGQTVAAGTVLGVLEAMKMELTLAAPYDGTVDEVTVAVGDQVALGHPMFTVVPAEEVS